MSGFDTTANEALPPIPYPWCEIAGSGFETSQNPAFLFVYVSLLVLWLVNTLVGSYGCYHLFRTDDNTPQSLKGIYCIIVFFSFVSPLGSAFGIQSGWQCWYGGDVSAFTPWEATFLIGSNGYYYALVFCNVFFMLRLKYIFRATALNEGPFWVPFVALIIALLCLPLVATVLFLDGWHSVTRGHALRCCTAFNVLSVLCNTLIMYVFIKRIVALSTMGSKTRSNSVSTSSPSPSTAADIDTVREEPRMVQIDQELMNVITRYAVTGVFVCLSTWIVIIYTFVFSSIGALSVNITARVFLFFLLGLDGSVSLICLSLQFRFSQNIYYKGCGGVIRVCGWCLARSFKIEAEHGKDSKEIGSKDSSPPNATTTAFEMSLEVTN